MKSYLSADIGIRPRGVAERPLAMTTKWETIRHYFTWILSLTKGKGKWKDIIVQIGGLAFKVELASRIPRI